jgi:hypothetical protein
MGSIFVSTRFADDENITINDPKMVPDEAIPLRGIDHRTSILKIRSGTRIHSRHHYFYFLQNCFVG